MVKLFDSTYILGSVLVLAAVAIAVAAVTRDELPLIGTGVGALIAVGVVGMAACSVAGIAEAPALGWTAPGIVIGSVLGVAALAIVLAGLLGWTGLLAPVAQLVQSGSTPVSGGPHRDRRPRSGDRPEVARRDGDGGRRPLRVRWPGVGLRGQCQQSQRSPW